MDEDRRRVLCVLAALPLVGCARPVTTPPAAPPKALPSLALHASVLELGRMVQPLLPEQSDREALVRRLGLSSESEPDAARVQRINATIAEEIDRGDLIDVEGWQLARTECRIYALAALLDANG